MYEKIPLKKRILAYFLKRHSIWIASNEVQKLVALYTNATPRAAVRRMQELCESGELEKKLVKNHAFYRAKPAIDYHAHAKEMIRHFDSL